MDEAIKQRIQDDITNNKIMLYMKGTPEEPQCGFSQQAANVLKSYNVEMATFNVFEFAGNHFLISCAVRWRRKDMYGLEAIAASNGWAMAIAGALIVMAGLAVLSFVISQLHIILELFEKRATPPEKESPMKTEAAGENAYDPERPFLNMTEAVRHYQNASIDLGERFELKDLYAVFYHSGFPHPHLTIRSLREDGCLIPSGDGYFSWNG